MDVLPADRLYWYDVVDVRGVDGDTCAGRLRLGFNLEMAPVTFRVAHINCNEINDNGGPGDKAAAFTKAALEGSLVLVHTSKRKDDYGRVLAEIWYGPAGTKLSLKNLAVELLAAGLAKPYEGHGPKPLITP
jgi:endonuclease YncB( thermonuclease family)